MNKKVMNEYLECEIFAPYRNSKNRLNLLDKIWIKYISPESNAIYLIRKKQYFEEKGRIGRVISRFYHVKLMRRYGIHITEGTKIGKGLRIAHPTSIVVTLCNIGENFTIYQNCTIGQKFWKSGMFPNIGNNVTMYANSSIIGAVHVADNVTLGAGAILLQDAKENGKYCGVPAKLIYNK